METNEVQKTEIVLFQHVLNKEQMSVILKNDSLLCKLCHVYLLQQSNKNPNLSNYTSDFIKQQDIIIKRYHLKIKNLVLIVDRMWITIIPYQINQLLNLTIWDVNKIFKNYSFLWYKYNYIFINLFSLIGFHVINFSNSISDRKVFDT